MLVDNNSASNVIILNNLKKIYQEKKPITKDKYSPIGFNGSTTTIYGSIKLPIGIEGSKLTTQFMILDTYSPFNVILGLLGIYALKVVPSTLHQLLRYPIEVGIKELNESKH